MKPVCVSFRRIGRPYVMSSWQVLHTTIVLRWLQVFSSVAFPFPFQVGLGLSSGGRPSVIFHESTIFRLIGADDGVNTVLLHLRTVDRLSLFHVILTLLSDNVFWDAISYSS